MTYETFLGLKMIYKPQYYVPTVQSICLKRYFADEADVIKIMF